ncbi:MAG: xylulokinase [Actinomycetota bacterium]|jgi:xylulokinase|nr:xylulokinase [Actinomycetota bacterium]
MAIFLGVDVGTATTKAVAVSSEGRVLGRAERRHSTSSPQPGWFEHDAETLWWADFRDCVSEVVRGLDEPPAAVAVSGIGPCLLPADADGRPLRPAILYGIDTRAEAQVRAMTERLGEEQIASTGAVLTSQAVGPKMVWLAEHEPAVWARTRMFFMASSFLVHRLTGRYMLDHQSASQCSPLYDQPAARWDTARWSEIAPDVLPPQLCWAGDVVGEVSQQASDATGIPAGTPVTAGTIDAWAEAESVLARDPGDVMVMYGSTMFLVAMTDIWRPSRQLWPTRGLRPDTSCLAAGMATSGTITEWWSRMTGAGFSELTAEAAQVPAGSDGLLLLPYFAGERTPVFDSGARGVLAGLTLHHSRGHVYRAVLEGVAYGVRHNLEAMREAGAEVDRLIAVGGGTTGGLWTQIVSDVTGMPQDVPRETVGASYGDAMLAAIATGGVSEEQTRHWNPVQTVVEPDAGTAALHKERFLRYREMYDVTRPLIRGISGSEN